jgi:hypothetical protein
MTIAGQIEEESGDRKPVPFATLALASALIALAAATSGSAAARAAAIFTY